MVIILAGNDIRCWKSRSAVVSRTHRFDVTVQEANRVDALDGLQDLAAQAQGGADAEGPAGHAPPQVGQVPALTRREHREDQFGPHPL